MTKCKLSKLYLVCHVMCATLVCLQWMRGAWPSLLTQSTSPQGAIWGRSTSLVLKVERKNTL